MTMPSSLKTIGNFAFYRSITASSATTRKILFNAALTTIGQSAFDGCNRIAFIDYADADTAVSLTEIGNNAFYGCTSLRFVKNTTGGASGVFFLTKALDDRVLESIGDGAFDGCTYSSTASSNRAVLNIYEDTESIGDYAFRNVKSIKTVNFYASNPDLGEGAFYGASNLTTVNYYEENGTNEDGSTKYTVSGTTSLSPELTSIPSLLFYGSGLNGFKLGSTVTSIGDGALSALTVSKDNKGELTTIKINNENFAIYKLAPYYTKETTSSGYYTESNDHYLLTSADMTVIYSYIGAFSDNATSVYNESVNQSRAGQFRFLQNLDINITSIRGYAFAETDFSYIWLPEKLTSFGANVFNGKVLEGDDMLYVTFEGKTADYYNTLLSGDNLSTEFLSGIEADGENAVIRLSGSQSSDVLDSFNSYFTLTGHYTTINI